MLFYHGRRGAERKILLRGDSEGRLALWLIPEVNNEKMKLVRQESFYRLPCKYSFDTPFVHLFLYRQKGPSSIDILSILIFFQLSYTASCGGVTTAELGRCTT